MNVGVTVNVGVDVDAVSPCVLVGGLVMGNIGRRPACKECKEENPIATTRHSMLMSSLRRIGSDLNADAAGNSCEILA